MPVLARYNLPAPVLGGLLVAVTVLIARGQGVTLVQFDTTLQSPLMIAFFTTIGFGASLSLLKIGGPQVLRFFLLATAFAVVQNVVGILMAVGFGLHPLFGVLAGSVTLTGGPATGLAFAPLFEEAGVVGASSVAIAVAIGGIVMGGLVGGPAGTVLIERGRIPTPRRARGGAVDVALVETETTVHASTDDDDAWPIVKNLVAILVAMWIGFWVSKGFAALGMTLPSYIGAMLVAAAIRNVDDVTGWFGLSHGFINNFGIVIAVAVPRDGADDAQALGARGPGAAACRHPRRPGRHCCGGRHGRGPSHHGTQLRVGRDERRVHRVHARHDRERDGGHARPGERYGPAPRAFLVAPIVGAFFIDFTNALIITLFLNLLT